MSDWFEALDSLGVVFFSCAVFGGVGLAFRMVLLFMTGIGDMDVGDHDIGDVDLGDADLDVDVDHAGIGHGDADASFHMLTLQGITGFFLMFGLVGLSSLGLRAWALLPALAAGILTLWFIAKMFQWARRLQSSGTLSMKNAIGQEGRVYMNIPDDGTGKVQVTVQDRLMTLNAVARDKRAIPTGERVSVVGVVSGNVLVVKRK